MEKMYIYFKFDIDNKFENDIKFDIDKCIKLI